MKYRCVGIDAYSNMITQHEIIEGSDVLDIAVKGVHGWSYEEFINEIVSEMEENSHRLAVGAANRRLAAVLTQECARYQLQYFHNWLNDVGQQLWVDISIADEDAEAFVLSHEEVTWVFTKTG